MSETPTIHLWDADYPDDEEKHYPIYVTCDLVPRVGDEVVYWVDYPHHAPEAARFDEGEPVRVAGTVARVRIEYRDIRYGKPKLYPMVSVYLEGYTAVPSAWLTAS